VQSTDIYNFIEISEELSTAGQPSEEQLKGIAQEGYEVIINLGLLDPRYCIEDEAGLVNSLGLEYVHIPVNFQSPMMDDLKQFFKVLDQSKGKKVFVHCAANYRVSSFVSLYGQAKLGWSIEEADEYIHNVWEPDSVWAEFIKSARDHLLPGKCIAF